ncbi:transcription factor bHLH113-like [Iris pallida]|uniref:Transcription factor bHLH113-like n=1 Tax=Iris pallida TaxID=29817 RepID=A0AAX6G5L0_IRIPA|nr:transcription factor bHLH113-like [Iris pallida]
MERERVLEGEGEVSVTEMLGSPGGFIYPHTSYELSNSATAQMLDFDGQQHDDSSPSSTTSSTCTISNSSYSKISSRVCSNSTSTTSTKRKRQKKESSPSMSTIKVRKEKLGDKMTELQQLVSPFGKSDTASVLQEALGYIRFLHDQVQVLSSPYMKCLPSSAHLQGTRPSVDLQSRGLCLVPVSCTETMVSDNGADFWSPAIGN